MNTTGLTLAQQDKVVKISRDIHKQLDTKGEAVADIRTHVARVALSMVTRSRNVEAMAIYPSCVTLSIGFVLVRK